MSLFLEDFRICSLKVGKSSSSFRGRWATHGMGDLLDHRLLGATWKPHLIEMSVPGGGFIPRPGTRHTRRARVRLSRHKTGPEDMVDLDMASWTEGRDLPGGKLVSRPVGDPWDRASTKKPLVPTGGRDKGGPVEDRNLCTRETGPGGCLLGEAHHPRRYQHQSCCQRVWGKEIARDQRRLDSARCHGIAPQCDGGMNTALHLFLGWSLL